MPYRGLKRQIPNHTTQKNDTSDLDKDKQERQASPKGKICPCGNLAVGQVCFHSFIPERKNSRKLVPLPPGSGGLRSRGGGWPARGAHKAAVTGPAFPQVPAMPGQVRRGPQLGPGSSHVRARFSKASCARFSNTFVNHLIKAH